MAQDRELVHRWFEELINQNDLAVADEILADDVVYHGPRSMSPREVTSPADMKKLLKQFHKAFPDIDYEVEAIVGDGPQYCVMWTAEGTHLDELFGISGEGETFTDEGVNVFTIEDGEITEAWSYWDTLGMVQDLNLVSPLGLAATRRR